jgi:hypothetical protein
MFATGGMQDLYMPAVYDRLQEQQDVQINADQNGLIDLPFPPLDPQTNDPSGNTGASSVTTNNNDTAPNDSEAEPVIVDLQKLTAAIAALRQAANADPTLVGQLSAKQFAALSGSDAKVRATLLASSPAGVKGLVADIDVGPDNTNVDKLLDTYALADLLLQNESLGEPERAVLDEVKKQTLARVGAGPASPKPCAACDFDTFRTESPAAFWGLIGALIFFFLAAVITWIVMAARGSGKRSVRAGRGGYGA